MQRIESVKLANYFLPLTTPEADREKHSLTAWASAVNHALFIDEGFTPAFRVIPKVRLRLFTRIGPISKNSRLRAIDIEPDLIGSVVTLLNSFVCWKGQGHFDVFEVSVARNRRGKFVLSNFIITVSFASIYTPRKSLVENYLPTQSNFS